MNGTLYGVGVGPGDPELLTLKAARLIGQARVIAYPAPKGGASFAREIAAAVIPAGAEELEISIPMDVARFPAQEVYDQAAEVLARRLADGSDVVVLCEGDPFFYGSFMYLFARLSARFRVEVVPGITSVSASAAAALHPLSARNQVLTILPGPLPEAALEARLATSDAFAIMKVGRHLPKIRAVLDRLGLTDHAWYLERTTLDAEVIKPMRDAPETAPYFSIILVRKGADPWLS